MQLIKRMSTESLDMPVVTLDEFGTISDLLFELTDISLVSGVAGGALVDVNCSGPSNDVNCITINPGCNGADIACHLGLFPTMSDCGAMPRCGSDTASS